VLVATSAIVSNGLTLQPFVSRSCTISAFVISGPPVTACTVGPMPCFSSGASCVNASRRHKSTPAAAAPIATTICCQCRQGASITRYIVVALRYEHESVVSEHCSRHQFTPRLKLEVGVEAFFSWQGLLELCSRHLDHKRLWRVHQCDN
jgi:hypothetical protein